MLFETVVTEMACAEGLYCQTPDRCEGHERTRFCIHRANPDPRTSQLMMRISIVLRRE